MAVKNSSETLIQKALQSGGIVYVDGVRVYVDNPDDFESLDAPTGFWVKNALGFKVYFKNTTRQAAQKACNTLFGSGRYTVNSKV